MVNSVQGMREPIIQLLSRLYNVLMVDDPSSSPSASSSQPLLFSYWCVVVILLIMSVWYGYSWYQDNQPLSSTGSNGELIPLGVSNYTTQVLPDNESIASASNDSLFLHRSAASYEAVHNVTPSTSISSPPSRVSASPDPTTLPLVPAPAGAPLPSQ